MHMGTLTPNETYEPKSPKTRSVINTAMSVNGNATVNKLC